MFDHLLHTSHNAIVNLKIFKFDFFLYFSSKLTENEYLGQHAFINFTIKNLQQLIQHSTLESILLKRLPANSVKRYEYNEAVI